MTQIIDYPFSGDFTGVNSLQANGVIDAGNNLPDGIGDRLSIENGVLKSTVSSSDEVTALGRRSEITAPANTRAEHWYGFEFMIPAGWNDAYPISIMQIHDTPDGGDNARHPNMLLVIEDRQIVARFPAAGLPAESTASARRPLLPLVKDKWYSCTLRANWQITTAGFREFLIDGTWCFRDWNLPVHYDDTTGPYLKIGAYDAFSTLSGERTAYFRNIKIWSGTEKYTAILGAPPKNPQKLLSAI